MSGGELEPAQAMALPPELLRLQGRARRFVDEELIPLEGELGDDAPLPEGCRTRIESEARRIGIWALAVPREYGGQGRGPLAEVLVGEALARTLIWPGIAELGNAMPVLLGGNEDQKQRYLVPVVRGEKRGTFALTERAGGSDPAGTMQTTATRRGERWILEGAKCFVPWGDSSDYFVVFAVTDPTQRRKRGITAFLVDRETPGLRHLRQIPSLGTMPLSEVAFEGCELGAEQQLGEVGDGLALMQRSLGGTRFWIGAKAVGMCERLLEIGIGYSRERKIGRQLLRDFGATQTAIADSTVEIEACRWMTYRAAAEAERGRAHRLSQSIVKVFASEMIGRVSDRILQLHGGWGYSKDLPIERFYRDGRMWRINEGPNEMHRWLIARAMLDEGAGLLNLLRDAT